MGWELRPNGRKYYTRSIAVAGRVHRYYVGAGEIGEQAAQEDAQRRCQREALAEIRRTQDKRWQGILATARPAEDLIALLLRATLTADGFHQTHRHWRKRRIAHGNCEPIKSAGISLGYDHEEAAGASGQGRVCRLANHQAVTQ